MSVVKRMEIVGKDYLVTTRKGLQFVVLNLEGTKKYRILTSDRKHNLGETERLQDVIDSIGHHEKVVFQQYA